jgi:Raf kinase inhibitor-like YbhB/YbcL family protein
MRAHEVTRKIAGAFRNVHAGDHKLAWHKLVPNQSATVSVSSGSFLDNGTLSPASTVRGDGTPPQLVIENVPEAAKSLVVICEDPDAPLPEPFVHWIVYGLPGVSMTLDARALGMAHEGKNSKLSVGFTPAAPPPGHGLHHYHFQVMALDVELGLPSGEGRHAVLEAMQGHVLAWGELVGTFEARQPRAATLS